MTDEELVKMARLAQRADRMSTGALYGDLADRIEQLQQALKDQSSVSDRLAEANEKMKEKFLVVMAERDEAWRRAGHAEEQWGRCEAKLAKAVEAVSLTVRADNLRETYHALPNDHNRIGDKRSRKGRAREAWLRAFRKAAKTSRATLAEIENSEAVTLGEKT